MIPSAFKSVDFRSIIGGSSAACDRLPRSPAVYAFFSGAPRIPVHDSAAFFEMVQSIVELPASPLHSATIGSLHTVQLANRSALSPLKQTRLRDFSEHHDFRSLLSSLMDVAAPLRSPLYVGQTVDLQRRIIAHLEPSSDLSSRLRETNLRLDDCVLVYAGIRAHPLLSEQATMTLLEEILTRFLRPGFVARIG